MALTKPISYGHRERAKSLAGSQEKAKPSFGEIVKETLAGKSIHRTLQNVAGRDLLDVPLSGIVLDVAAGSKPGNYRRFLPQDDVSWVTLDLNKGRHPNVVASMNEPFPFKDESFDNVVFYNGVHIADEPAFVMTEIHRILKPGGRFMISAPTIFEQVPEPHDYWRFTGEGLERDLSYAGFSTTRTIRLGGGRWTSAVYVLTPYLRPMLVRTLVYSSAVWMDGLIDNTIDRMGKRMLVIPIGFVSLATKTGG